jgi:sterol desaturase/sphingolipid hydroxylase (fatty acid hydroxylase superfamily)
LARASAPRPLAIDAEQPDNPTSGWFRARRSSLPAAGSGIAFGYSPEMAARTMRMLQTITQNAPIFVVDLVRLCLLLAFLAAIFVPLERLFALHPARIWRKGIGADLGFYFLTGMVAALLLSFPLGLAAWALHRMVPASVQSALNGASFWARAFAAFVVGEIGYYWGHRLMHTVPFLWRFHAIHHSAEHIDFLVNSRTHPVDLVFGRLCAFAPIYTLGLAQLESTGGALIPALVSLTGTAWSFFIHTNVWWRFGPLEWVISTPRFHHWHHALEPANRNYASMLPILDRIFGTCHLPEAQFPPRYGIPATVPDSFVNQLVRPLLGPFPLPRANDLVPVQTSAEMPR